jgi:CheY-like chemotaxis protein
MTSTEQKPRLLMVEDNPGDVELFRWALERAEIDCELSVIEDGGDALDMVRGKAGAESPATPDLIVLDLNLPKVGGLEILKQMRAGGPFVNVPVIVMTSSTSPRERERLEPLRVARHLTKPSDLDEFLNIGSIVKDVLNEQR